MPVVQYLVQVPTPDEEPVLDAPIGSFELDRDGAVTLATLRDSWPFAGTFHFRTRFALAPEATFGWIDLTADDDEVPVVNGVCTVRVLPLFPIVAPGPPSDFSLSPVEYEAWLHENALRRAAELRARDEAGEAGAARPVLDTAPDAAAAAPAAFGTTSGPPVRARSSTAGSDPWGVFGGSGGSERSDVAAAPTAAALPSAAVLATSASAIAGNMLQGFRGFMASASRAVAAAGAPAPSGGDAPPAAKESSKAAAKGGAAAAAAWFSGVAKGARGAIASAAKAIDKTLAAGSAVGAPASPPAAAALLALQRLLRTPVRADFAPHDGLLRRLWAAAFGADEPFELPSPLWAQLGFDGEDPCAAINHQGAGALALYALVHVAEAHGGAFDEMVARAVSAAAAGDAASAGPYPPALAVMALSCRLAQRLGLGLLEGGDATDAAATAPPPPGRMHEPFWEAFGSGSGGGGQAAFYELVGLAWRAFDRAWLAEGARAADFERVVDAAAMRAQAWLDQGPQSIEQLVSAAEMEGVSLGVLKGRGDD